MDEFSKTFDQSLAWLNERLSALPDNEHLFVIVERRVAEHATKDRIKSSGWLLRNAWERLARKPVVAYETFSEDTQSLEITYPYALQPGERQTLMLVDDAMYTGQQKMNMLNSISASITPDNPTTVLMAIPYSTLKAQTLHMTVKTRPYRLFSFKPVLMPNMKVLMPSSEYS